MTMQIAGKYTVAIKTHYINARIVDMWLNISFSQHALACYILLNNEDNVLPHFLKYLPPSMRDYVIPFDSNSLRAIGLPVVPSSPKWRNSWRNGDYGFYYLLKTGLLDSFPDLSHVFQLDNDIGLCGVTWAQYFDYLLLNDCDVFTLGHKESPETWPHHQAAKLYYDNPYKCIFGLQGIRKVYIQKLLERRKYLADKAYAHCSSLGLNLHELSNDQAMVLYPICESFFSTEVQIQQLVIYDIIRNSSLFWDHFNIRLDQWGQVLPAKKSESKPFFLYHPIKEACYNFRVSPS